MAKEEVVLVIGGKNAARRRFWVWVGAAAVGVPLAVVLALLVAVLVRAGVAAAPHCNIALLNEAQTAGVADPERHPERVRRLAAALTFPTVSFDVANQTTEQFPLLIQHLRDSFPVVHSSELVEVRSVNSYSLLYKVQGSEEGKLAYLLTAHLDVVPAPPDKWTHPPFSGAVVDGFVYGRGAIDDKGSVMGILEALEHWLATGARPKRTFFIALGHDEEIGGEEGAAKIAEQLRQLGVSELDFVLDEGLMATDKIVPGVSKPVALIGVSEKGFVNVEMEVSGVAQHSSFPPDDSPIGILGRAVSRLEDKQQPIVFGRGPEAALFQHVAPDTDFGIRMIYANLWLFKPLLGSLMTSNPLTNTLVKTSTGLVRFNSGIKDNVIPAVATALVNHRVHPGQTVSEVVERDRRTIGDERVTLKAVSQMEAHQVSPFGPDDLAYQLIATSVRQSFDQVVVAPCIMIANTDTVHYLPFSRQVFRFFPTLILPEDAARYHGDNERIGVDDYRRVVDFYFRLMQNADLVADLAPNDHREL